MSPALLDHYIYGRYDLHFVQLASLLLQKSKFDLKVMEFIVCGSLGAYNQSNGVCFADFTIGPFKSYWYLLFKKPIPLQELDDNFLG